ncbi:MAG: adenylate/guanylate cyclase domain-containing protein [Candidatus Marinimicrobia bacterium]|jgi:adenylate cyclase|nr:adenylate/guanylate cyclase domain-containing protein [Candidatus Neomarinimicrobiota bacterium]
MIKTNVEMKNSPTSVLQRFRRTPLEFKILFLIVFCLTVGFGSYVVYSLQSESKALMHQHRLRSHLFGETLISGIRNIMLSGRAPYVRAFVEEAREEFNKVGEFHLFNNQAEEIFPAKDPHISIPVKNPQLNEQLKQNRFSDDLLPIKNEASCKACHADGYEYRGAVKLEFSDGANWESALVQVVHNAFQAIMLSGKGEYADTLLMEINELPGVNLLQVYDNDATYVAFGDDDEEVNEEILEDVADTYYENTGYKTPLKKDRYHFTPFANLESCHVCHSPDSDLRGILAIEMQAEKVQRDQVIRSTIIGFNNLMRLQKASYAGAYIDEVRLLPFVKNFQVFDNGQVSDSGFQELWVPNPDYDLITMDSTAEKLVQMNNQTATTEIQKLEYTENLRQTDYLTQVAPIINDEKCQACHQPPEQGSPLYESQKDKWKVRSVVKVSTSMQDIQDEIEKNTQASVIVGLVTLFLVAFLLRMFMKATVLKPLDIIGGVADKIGEGDLSVHARVKSQDEIGILAQRINKMIKGLQERLHLTKFVSDEALTAVEKADLEGLALGGERREATVLFSDIRGFTSMSEKMEPEDVVNLLNSYFDKQTEVVQDCGGDIDKFVGDELMAVFKGEEMADQAVECALKIQEEVKKLNQELEKNIGIGIGINTGPMVMGAMGSKERMDYTVIGDNVNLGARLCSAAGAREVIISENTQKLLAEKKYQLEKLDPIQVKGKEEPIQIYRVE